VNRRSILLAQNRAVIPNGAVLHSASVGHPKQGAYLFLAPSGGGKSTIRLKLCRKVFGAIGDDSTVVCTGTDGVVRCLPCGSMKQATGVDDLAGAALRAIFFVEKGSPPLIFKINPAYAFYRAVSARSVMDGGELDQAERKALNLFLNRLVLGFPSYIFRYGLDDDPEELLHSFLSNG